MKQESRVHKSLLNAKVGLIFYFLTLVVLFFSRKVFLDCLGPEFVGLTSTLNSILCMLNLAEFGVANSIAYFLYTPIADNDKQKINDIVSVCGYLYRRVGNIILCCGIIVSFFFPIWFDKTNVSLTLVYFAYFSILGSSLITYYINYRNQLLTADQKQYVVQGYFKAGNILKNIIQIVIAVYWPNLYLWVLMEFSYAFICCIVLNLKINKEYPWLETSIEKGEKIFHEYKYILDKCKQIATYNIKYFALNKSDELFVFIFVSLKMVAFYGNYVMIISKLTEFVTVPFNGMLASVGNLVAEGDNKKIHQVFWELLAMLYFVAAILVAGIYFFVSPLICLWLGDEYVLSQWIVLLLCLNTFIYLGHLGVYFFNNAYGNYHDVWASWAEAVLNICITVIAAWKLGIEGILLGKFISTLVFLVIWKPIMLYRDGFKSNITEYVKNILIYITVILFYLISIYIIQVLFPISMKNIGDLIMSFFVCYIPVTLLFILVFIKIAPGANYVYQRVKTRFNF